MNRTINPAILFILLLAFTTFLNGCSTTKPPPQNSGPPTLSQDELIRPYMKLGRILVTREVFGTDYSMSPDIKAWGLAAVREEAEKMGADAIMLPEISGHTTIYGIIPSTEYHATGFAIKFK